MKGCEVVKSTNLITVSKSLLCSWRNLSKSRQTSSYTVICFFFCCKIIFVCKICTKISCNTRSNYSNRAVIYVNHTKIFLHENFYHENFLHENKVNYGRRLQVHKKNSEFSTRVGIIAH